MKDCLIKFLTVAILVLSSCGNTNDYSEDLGNGYRFIHSGGGLRFISGSSSYKSTEIYPTVIEYEFDNNYVLVAQQPEKEDYKAILSGYIGSDYSFYMNTKADSTFLVRKNWEELEPLILKDSLTYQKLERRGLTAKNSVSDMEIVDDYIDSLFLHDEYYKKMFSRKINYWILDKEKEKLFGPYSWEEYENKRQGLRIKMQLKSKNN